MINTTESSYTAGIIDGEGCIIIVRQLHTKWHPSVAHNLIIQVTNTSRDLMDWLYLTYGGRVTVHNRGDGRRRRSWRWWCTPRKERDFLLAIRPYLIIKARAADLALEFLAIKRTRGKRLTEGDVTQREWYKIEISKLAVGRQTSKSITELIS